MTKNKKGVKKCFATGKPLNEKAKHVILVTKQGNKVLEETYFSMDGWRNHIGNLVNKKYDELEERAFKEVQKVADQFLNSFVKKKNGGKSKKATRKQKRK